MAKAASIIVTRGEILHSMSKKVDMQCSTLGVSKRDQEVYNFIKAFVLKNNLVPSFREIAEGVNLKSISSVNYHMKSLIKAGYIIPYEEKSIRYSVKGLKVVECE